MAINANNFFAPKPNNLRVRNSKRVVVTGNTFNPRQFVRAGTILFESCADCVVANCTLHKFATTNGAIILRQCNGFSLNGLNLSDCGSGIVLKESTDCTIANCRVTRTGNNSPDISIDPSNKKILLSGNAFTGTANIQAQ